jgi:hypothetical protein
VGSGITKRSGIDARGGSLCLNGFSFGEAKASVTVNTITFGDTGNNIELGLEKIS